MNQMVPCPQCGAPLRVGERFCGNCGTGLSWPTQQQPPPYQQPQPPPYQYQQSPPYQPPPQNQQWQAPPPQYQGYQQQPPGWGQSQPPPPGWIPPQQPPGWPPQYGQQQRFSGPPPGKQGSSNLILVLSIVLIVILAVGGIGIATNGTFKFGSTPASPASSAPPSSSQPTGSSTSNNSTAANPTPTSISVTADQLISAYNANAETARATYRGKIVTVSGKVATLDASVPSVTLKGDTSTDFDIDCFFSSGDRSAISNLDLDQAVKVKGTVGDFAAGLLKITGCIFVN